jgi:hypothetical protein
VTDHLDLCLQRERRKETKSVEDLRALLVRHGIKMDAASYARMSLERLHVEWRALAYSEAVAAGIVYG